METSKVKLKLLIDKKQNIVLFAEAGKDFVDFLVYLLTLPLGAVMKLFKQHSVLGSLANLYKSIEELDTSYIQTTTAKQSVLNPTASSTSIYEFPSRLLACDEPASDRGRQCYYSSSNEKGFVKGLVTYMVMDNLEVSPLSAISGISLFSKFKVQETNSLEERVVYLGMPEALKLLVESFKSQTVLTSVFLSGNKLVADENERI